MSPTVRTLFGHREKPGYIGMELEVEAHGLIPAPTSNIWLVKEDHSLRNNGYEFYTRNPITYDGQFISRIRELTSYLQNKSFRVDYNSTRTSFHVHINMMHHSMIQMWNQVFAYWLLEKPLMRICGPSRCGNMFCLRASDAEAMIFSVGKILNSSFKRSMFRTDNLRYSSQNLKALSDFGSVEYRGMRGTHDADLLHDWAGGLYLMSQNTKQFANPGAMLDFYDANGAEALVTKVLPGCLSKYVLAQTDYASQISEGFDIIFSTVYDADWEALEKSYSKLVPESEGSSIERAANNLLERELGAFRRASATRVNPSVIQWQEVGTAPNTISTWPVIATEFSEDGDL